MELFLKCLLDLFSSDTWFGVISFLGYPIAQTCSSFIFVYIKYNILHVIYLFLFHCNKKKSPLRLFGSFHFLLEKVRYFYTLYIIFDFLSFFFFSV